MARRSRCCWGYRTPCGALRHLPLRRAYWARAAKAERLPSKSATVPDAGLDRDFPWDFLTARQRLVASGVPVVDAALAHSEDEAADRRCAGSAPPVAVKAEAPGLLHKSDLGCVRLGLRGRTRRSARPTGGRPELRARPASRAAR